MIRTRFGRPLAALTTVVVASAGLVAASSVSADAASSTTTFVHVTADHHVQMARHVRPGVHTFKITSATSSSIELVHPRRGYTLRAFVADVNGGVNGGNVAMLRRFERNVVLIGGANATPGHPSVLTVRIPGGRLWVADSGVEKLTRSLVHTGHASGRYAAGHVVGNATVTAVGEDRWSSTPASIPTGGVLRFANTTVDNHFVELAKIADGKTYSDFVSWIKGAEKGAQDPPPVDESVSFGTGVVGPHRAMAASYSLPAGDYVLICFWPDADHGGMPHAFMGMYRELHVG